MAQNTNNANQLAESSTRDKHNVYITPRLSRDNGLQRTASDTTFELNKEAIEPAQLPTISKVENAKCECCGMCEECTQEYIKSVLGMFSGKFICGLCAAAVNEEMGKNGGKQEEALEEHMSACVKFNRLGRSYPALYQAEAMRKILKMTSRSRAMSTSPSKK